MIGTLNPEQIDQILSRDLVGRLGIRSSSKIYIIPVAFAYEKGFIYGHSKEGSKIKMMRKTSDVSFQVDEIDDLQNWRSILIFGKYEELIAPAEQQKAKTLLTDKFTPYKVSETTRTFPPSLDNSTDKPIKNILFRIRISAKTGRFEKSDPN